MDMKNLTYQLLGLTLKLKLPSLWREEEDGAEYQLKIEESKEHKVSYLQWRYGHKLEQMVTARAQPDMQTVITEETENILTGENKPPIQDKKPASQDKPHKRLRKDFRVINNLMSPEQITNIEQWLADQPDHFQTEQVGEIQEVQEVRGRNTNVKYRKVSIV